MLIVLLKVNVVYIIVLFLALGIGYAFLTKSSIDTRGCEKSVSDANERDHQAFVKQRDEQADVIEVYEKNKEGDDE